MMLYFCRIEEMFEEDIYNFATLFFWEKICFDGFWEGESISQRKEG